MFMASAFLGYDGESPTYRSLAYEMADRLRIEERIAESEDDTEKRAYSTAIWGIYCCEK